MDTTRGEIITFYSYKGGVGRSMALANVACLLAKKQKRDGKILMIDWDLEAPGLHQFFHGKFNTHLNKKGDLPSEQLGLIDLFYDIKTRLEKTEILNDFSEKFFSELNLQKYIVEVDIPSLFLMPAGKTDGGMYSTQVNEFDWADFFNKFPLIITKFAQYLREKYNYVLIDSRTGYTDISGICTSIMPEKLVTVFTPNRQSLSGVVEMIRRATDYRMQSDDLRPLMIFPLPSRIENAEADLQKQWRFGKSTLGLEGYQRQFETVFTEVYHLQNCDLTKYFDQYQLRYTPKYSYGEELAVLSERYEDKFTLANNFENFVKKIISFDSPWEEIKDPNYRYEEEHVKDKIAHNEKSKLDTGARIRSITGYVLAVFSVFIYVFIVWLILADIPTAQGTQSPFSVMQFVYDFLNWQYFGFLLIIWLAINIIWINRWQSLFARITKLLLKPVIFVKDSSPDDIPIYPRNFLESLANSRHSDEDKKTSQTTFGEFFDAQRDRVFDAKHPLRSLGYLITFIGFWFFALSNLIIIANTMLLMDLMFPPLPTLLQRLDLAILGGSFLSSIVGVWMLIEMSGSGELINNDQLNNEQKRIYKSFAFIIILMSIIVMFTLAVERLFQLDYLQSSATSDLILTFILYGLLAINNSLSTALTFSPMASGFVVVFFILSSVFPVLVFFVDIAWRFVYIIIDFVLWFLITPIISIPYAIFKLFRLIQ